MSVHQTYRGLDKLDRRFRDKVEFWLEDCEELGIFITETWRSKERQAYLVDQGYSWTMDSDHRKGLAVDIAFEGKELYPMDIKRWEVVAMRAKKWGILWGYEQWGKDLPHFMDNSLPVPRIQKMKVLYRRGSKRLKETLLRLFKKL
jgi:hypothetical protein